MIALPRQTADPPDRIAQCRFDFEVFADTGPLSTPERLLAAIRAELLPEIDATLAAHDGDCLLEHLVIDLGDHDATPDWHDLRARLRRQLTDALALGSAEPARPPQDQLTPKPAPNLVPLLRELAAAQAKPTDAPAPDTGAHALPDPTRPADADHFTRTAQPSPPDPTFPDTGTSADTLAQHPTGTTPATEPAPETPAPAHAAEGPPETPSAKSGDAPANATPASEHATDRPVSSAEAMPPSPDERPADQPPAHAADQRAPVRSGKDTAQGTVSRAPDHPADQQSEPRHPSTAYPGETPSPDLHKSPDQTPATPPAEGLDRPETSADHRPSSQKPPAAGREDPAPPHAAKTTDPTPDTPSPSHPEAPVPSASAESPAQGRQNRSGDQHLTPPPDPEPGTHAPDGQSPDRKTPLAQLAPSSSSSDDPDQSQGTTGPTDTTPSRTPAQSGTEDHPSAPDLRAQGAVTDDPVETGPDPDRTLPNAPQFGKHPGQPEGELHRSGSQDTASPAEPQGTPGQDPPDPKPQTAPAAPLPDLTTLWSDDPDAVAAALLALGPDEHAALLANLPPRADPMLRALLHPADAPAQPRTPLTPARETLLLALGMYPVHMRKRWPASTLPKTQPDAARTGADAPPSGQPATEQPAPVTPAQTHPVTDQALAAPMDAPAELGSKILKKTHNFNALQTDKLSTTLQTLLTASTDERTSTLRGATRDKPLTRALMLRLVRALVDPEAPLPMTVLAQRPPLNTASASSLRRALKTDPAAIERLGLPVLNHAINRLLPLTAEDLRNAIRQLGREARSPRAALRQVLQNLLTGTPVDLEAAASAPPPALPGTQTATPDPGQLPDAQIPSISDGTQSQPQDRSRSSDIPLQVSPPQTDPDVRARQTPTPDTHHLPKAYSPTKPLPSVDREPPGSTSSPTTLPLPTLPQADLATLLRKFPDLRPALEEMRAAPQPLSSALPRLFADLADAPALDRKRALQQLWSALPAPPEPAAFWAILMPLLGAPSPLDQLCAAAIAAAAPDPDDRPALTRLLASRFSQPHPLDRDADGLRISRQVHEALTGLLPAQDSPQSHEATTMLSHCAGLALFGPFLPRLFTALKLTDGKTLTDPARAAAVLARLTGFEGPRPPDPLERCLLALPPEVKLTWIDLDDADTTLTDSLLPAVIAHWGKLGQTSPEGLQEAFLRRDGTLTQDATGPRLNVAPKPFDVLLDGLPWALSPMRLPWMPAPLFVSWRDRDDL